jgi:hypothetical protein
MSSLRDFIPVFFFAGFTCDYALFVPAGLEESERFSRKSSGYIIYCQKLKV